MTAATSALIFGTHHFVKRLTQAGMAVEIAEVLVEEQARLIDNRLATKEDLKRLEGRIEAKLDKMDAKIDRLFLRMTVTFGGLILAAVSAVAALMRFWPTPTPMLMG